MTVEALLDDLRRRVDRLAEYGTRPDGPPHPAAKMAAEIIDEQAHRAIEAGADMAEIAAILGVETTEAANRARRGGRRTRRAEKTT